MNNDIRNIGRGRPGGSVPGKYCTTTQGQKPLRDKGSERLNLLATSCRPVWGEVTTAGQISPRLGPEAIRQEQWGT